MDGSTVPSPPSSRGTSGAAAILWAVGTDPRPVASALSSHLWATAISAEIAAVQLALSWLAATPLSACAGFRDDWNSVLRLPALDAWFDTAAFLDALHTVVEVSFWNDEGGIRDWAPKQEREERAHRGHPLVETRL